MHSEHIWHRDIKPDNLLISESTLKFIDFGISKSYNGDAKHLHTKNVVTRCYRPPEIFFGDRTYKGEAVDVWSAGCVFAEILTGSVLFPGQSDIEQLSLIFDVLGVPAVEDWPEVEFLPCYLPFNPQKPKDLETVLNNLKLKQSPKTPINDKFVSLIKQMLQLNPAKRIKVNDCINLI